jgi:hypothetical protein
MERAAKLVIFGEANPIEILMRLENRVECSPHYRPKLL